MKNILPILALLMSVSGIAVSLGREEVRCHLGLESAACPREEEKTSEDTPATTRESPPATTPATTPESPRIEATPAETTRNIEPSPEVFPSPKSETPVEFTPIPENNPSPEVPPENPPTPETKAVEKTPDAEKSPDVNPSKDGETKSIPLEVIPPAQ
ncbi:MAG: hypothetical protein RPG89_12575 [Microcystis panniformis WG22]|nr:hypothetical protein [Microcystis panniformis WG22]